MVLLFIIGFTMVLFPAVLPSLVLENFNTFRRAGNQEDGPEINTGTAQINGSHKCDAII